MLAMKTRRRATSTHTGIKSAFAAAAVLTLVAGCGGGDGDKKASDDFAKSDVADIIAAAKKDMADLDSVHLSGEFTSTDSGSVKLDLGVSTAGECSGSIEIGGGTAQILSADGKSWFKPDEAFWRASAGEQADTIIGIVGDKWVVLPPDDTSFTSFCDLDELLKDITDTDPAEKEFVNDGTEDFDGDQAVKLSRTDTDGGKITAFVATDDPHYVVHMVKTGGDDPGEATFSEFDEELDIQPPAESDTIDLNSLG